MRTHISADGLDVYIKLARIGVTLRPDGLGGLQVAPWSAVRDDLREAIRAQKQELLDVLCYTPEAVVSPVMRCYCTVWLVALSHDAERIGADEETPDDELLVASGVMVERIRGQQARGYFPGGRWVNGRPEKVPNG